MKFRHKIEQINFNGVKETKVNYYHCDEIYLGRGSNCLIRLEDRSVALTHAKLFQVGDNLVVEDCSGGQGTYVNGKAIKQSVLNKNDQLKIGEINFKVLFDPSYWGLLEVRREIVKEDSSELIGKQLKNLNLNKFYPRFWSLITLFVIAIIVFCFVDQFYGENLIFWNSGPLSKHHKLLENDCRSCHEKPYQTVQDKVCMRCHNLTKHAAVLGQVVAKHPEVNFRCANCHFEHTGDSAIKLNDSRLCLQCHGRLDKFYPETKHPVITDFKNHPQFSVHLPQYKEDEIIEVKKVPLNKIEELVDPTRIKFPHKKHLVKDLKSPNGPKTLECQECHKYTANLKEMEPINFQKNCSTCHSLGFDERLPDKVVPHGNADLVYNYLYAEYAKLFLDNEKVNSRKSFVQRFRPGQEIQAENPTVEFTKSFVDEEARKAEQQLFTKTACYLCHEIKRNDQGIAGKSNFYVYPPNVPKKWMSAANFSHKPHQYLSCADCHHGAKNSETAKDILIPQINDCQNCHQAGKHQGKVSADCVTCHSYHDSLSLK